MGKLLAIVEVDENAKVYCQAEGCTATVYKRIHVVKDGEKIIVLGSTCYSKLYGGSEHEQKSSYYTGSESRRLTDEERQMLLSNTLALIDHFEAQAQAQAQIVVPKAIEVTPTNFLSSPQVMLRDVWCYFCGSSMKTHAKRTPPLGHKCELCIKYNRHSPNPKFGITKEKNALANRNETY